MCKDLTYIIEAVGADLQSPLRKKRAWTSLKATTRSKHVKRFREALSETKSTLMIAMLQQLLVPLSLCTLPVYMITKLFYSVHSQALPKIESGRIEKHTSRKTSSTQPLKNSIKDSLHGEGVHELMLRTLGQATSTPKLIQDEFLARDEYIAGYSGSIRSKTCIGNVRSSSDVIKSGSITSIFLRSESVTPMVFYPP